ncbi:carboxypeptidase A2-like isoform X2 [Salvelinus fontinalis]|uniref:carboxypeptidase A2-like isoform X2 n=1 Tax=Salvelinus fontinalis TaxID=8038 RepID=UPI0024865F83|nr:carboxypeptidase A2-like isoform X2 [Salvelinus fontinalis]
MKVLVLFALLAAANCEKVFIGDQVIRVNVESEEQILLLRALEQDTYWDLDFWLHPVNTEVPVDIRVPYSSLYAVKDYLHAHNIQFSVMISNLQELLDEEKAEMEENNMRERSSKSFNFGAYHPLETIYSWMDGLVAAHPNLVTKEQIGTSYEGRPMYVLKFSTGGDKRPAIWVDSGIHSREWVSQATGVWTANKIASDYGTDASLTSLLKTMDIYLLILANPDGYVHSHTILRPHGSQDRMWRKTRSKNPGSMCRGVDPNRNWDAGFGGPGASTNPCSDSYHGPSPHSEIEVKNVVNLVKNHGNFKSFISIHAYSQLLMYPYGYTCKDALHAAELDSVGRSAVQKLSSLHGTTFKVGSICKIIYQASGGSIDWSYNLGIKYSFAFELRDTGRYGFILPANQIIPTASETWLALKDIMEYVHDHSY